jgi:hypothetical protein
LSHLGLRSCHGLCCCCRLLWCCGALRSGGGPKVDARLLCEDEVCIEDTLVIGYEIEAGASLLPVAFLYSVVQTPALAAESRVLALGQGVTGVEALGTGDVAGVLDCWRGADGGQVAYRVASLAVVAIRTGNREAGAFQQDVAFYLDRALPLLQGLIVPGLLLGLLILSLLLLLRLLGLLLLVVVLAVAVVLVSRVIFGPPIGPVGTLLIGMGRVTGARVHVALITRLGRRRVDPDVSTIRVVGVVGVVVARITITTIAVTIAVAIAINVTVSIAILP